MIALSGFANSATAQPGSPSVREWEVAGEIVVFPRSLEVGRQLREQLVLEKFVVLGFAPISGMMIVSVEPGLERSMIEYFRLLPQVRAAERSYRGEYAVCGGPGTPPTAEPDFSLQWHLHNTGQSITGTVSGSTSTVTITGTCGVDIDAIRAWQRTRGSPDVWLAVLDSGIDVSISGVVNSEFTGRLVPNNLAISLSCPEIGDWTTLFVPSTCCCVGSVCDYGYPFDLRHHGTKVTGVAAANHNAQSVLGVDPQCTVLPVRVDAGDSASMARTIVALETIDENNEENEDYEKVRVINMSYQVGWAALDDEQTGALLNVLASLREEDVFVVAAAGNFEGSPSGLADARLPSGSPDVITVGGTDNQDRRCDPAVFGGSATFSSGRGASLDFMAPAFAIATVGCNTSGCTCGDCEDYHCQDGVGQPAHPASGTSGSAPMVAGIITLLFARADALSVTLDWDQVYALLKDGAVDLGDPGHDWDYGWGRVNAYETIVAMERQYYSCDADITHTDDPGAFGYGVPDGKVDASDLNAFLDLYAAGEAQADVTTTGYTTPGGATPNGEPDTNVDSDDFYYFLSFYANCGTLGLCPSCP